MPKGSVIYMFEKVDMKKAKDTVGKMACICGNLATATLMFSSKERVIKETRELLDICAPGADLLWIHPLLSINAPRKISTRCSTQP